MLTPPRTFLAALILAFLAAPVSADVPSYQRHVSALFSRLACNGGTCHGAVQGQNGFRLSLFGADPDLDHLRLLRDTNGRRLDLQMPATSLLLKKATGQIPHEGGTRTGTNSFEYDVLRRWIAAGAPIDEAAGSRLKQLRVLPAEQVVREGQRAGVRVEADFADGSTEDVTRYCTFTSLDSAIASVDNAGTVTATGVGDAALIVRYRAQPAMARVLVPRSSAKPFPQIEANNFIDTHILTKLRQLNLPPAELCDDATFLRRASLDVTGELPSADEVRAFLDDASPFKRTRKIDDLLSRSGHSALWAMKFCDILKASDFGVYADAFSQEADSPRFQAWVRARLRENVPYDQFVERILLATSREGRDMEAYGQEVIGLFEGYAPGRKDLDLYASRKTLDLYWQRRGSDGVGGAMQVAHAFLGLRLECAQCHRHPHDVWQQEDLLDFANHFMRVRKVGFQGENEKRFADAAVLFKRYNEEGKKLEAESKKLKDANKTLDADVTKAKAEITRLTNEISRLEKLMKADELIKSRQELAAKQTTLASYEKQQREIAEMARKAKNMPEVARRLLQGEARILSPGNFAKVTSPLGTRESKAFRLLGEATASKTSDDPREAVMTWMRRSDNPYFARAIVNRVWAHYFGRGIIDPPDNLSSFNPATHPELLKQLCDEFVRHGYDLLWLHRTILHSRTYQQSSTAAPESASDRANYAAFPIRRLLGEVMLDALDAATGTYEVLEMQFYHWPTQLRAVEMPYMPRNEFVAHVLETFGRPKRNAAVQCDCERESSVSILQVLTLANHPRVWEKIKSQNGRVATLLKSQPDAPAKEKWIEELYLSSLSRRPSAAERAACLKALGEAKSTEEGLQGVLWALINTREFLLQH